MTVEDALSQADKPLFFSVANGRLLRAPAMRHADAIRVCVRSLSGMQKEALAVSARTGAIWRLASDEGAYLAGFDAAPCPLAFLTTGMISSYMTEITALAEQRSIRIDAIRLIQDNFYTMRGSARDGTMTGGARNVHLTAQISGSEDQATLQSLVLDATAASPLNGLMRGEKESLFSLTHNGIAIESPGQSGIPHLDDGDPVDLFDAAQPAAGDFSNVIRRGGTSPKVEHTVTMANDSLRDHQDRLLHIRGICTLREDGVKEIEQQLFNPHGSIFHFLSEESATGAGAARAPDAATYICAGIGFCFMTQFGRYAKIVGADLRDYRITQDGHFSAGGASGGTGRAGSADPIETHAYLDTGEDDAFAREALRMAEQTCFLHAFCRTDLKTRVKVQPYGSDVPQALAATG